MLTTVFTAVRSEAFVSDFKTFFMVIWQFIVNAFQLLLKGGQWASQLGDKIPQPVVATIVHYLLLIVFVGGNPYQSSFTADTGTYRLCADKVVCKRVYEVERILLN